VFIRVLDEKRNQYYQSIVYGMMHIKCSEHYIVYHAVTDSFELIEKNDVSICKANIDFINGNQDDWVFCQNVQLLKLKYFLIKKGCNGTVHEFQGYEDIYENFDFLYALITKKEVHKNEFDIPLRQLPDIDDWHYLSTQDEADDFLDRFAGFHDAAIESMQYEENDFERTLRVVFDNSCWYGRAELVFEGLIALNLRPGTSDYTRELYECCLIVQDEAVFWADEALEAEDRTYNGSYIKALSVKWRKLEDIK